MAEVKESAHDEVVKILQSCTVDDVVFDRPVISIGSNATISEALHALTDNHILSVPVYDQTEQAYVGFVDYNDVIELILQCYKTMPASGKHVFADVTAYLSNMSSAADQQHVFKNIVNLSRRNPYHAVPPGTSLFEIARMLGQEGIHRVPVEKDGKIIKIISQSCITSILATNFRLFSHVLQGTVESAGLLKEVVSIPASTPILEALEKIASSHISGVAVLDNDNGTMVANLSSSDIRVLLATEAVHYDFFSLTALRAIQVSRAMLPEHPTPGDARSYPAVVMVHPNTLLVDVIEKLAATKLHRLYVTDEAGKPVGVVTLKDILAYWIRSPKALATIN